MTGGRIAALYAIWALPLVLALAWIVPPWTNTDEPFHMLRAVSLAHGHIVGTSFDNPDTSGPAGSGGFSDNAIFEAFAGFAKMSWLEQQPNGQVTAALLKKSDAVKWHRDLGLAWFGSTAQYPPSFYLPDIAGYWIGRAAGMRVNATLMLSRCLNSIMFVAMSAAAIARARRLRLLLVTLLMLPMTLALAASANQDAGIIATTALVVAELDRIAADGRHAFGLELSAMAAGLAFVSGARPPYIGLLPLLTVAAPGRRGRLALIAAFGAVGVWCGLVALFVMRALGGSDPRGQFLRLVAHPALVLTIAVNSFAQSLGTYCWEFVGRLAWNDTPLPRLYLVLAYTAIALAACASTAGPGLGRRTVLAGTLFVAAAIFGVQYLDWTPLGMDHVVGVTGRYFLPPVIALGLALPNWRQGRHFTRPAHLAVALLGAVTPAVMLHHIVLHFYVVPGTL